MEDKKCNNPKCVYHTPVVHGFGCTTSGSNACQDVIHKKECWTQEEKEKMVAVLDHYINTRYPDVE